MNKFLKYALYSFIIVVVWNIIRFFLETIYVNKLTEDYTVFTTKYHLNIIIFIFTFICLFFIEPFAYKIIKNKNTNAELPSS